MDSEQAIFDLIISKYKQNPTAAIKYVETYILQLEARLQQFKQAGLHSKNAKIYFQMHSYRGQIADALAIYSKHSQEHQLSNIFRLYAKSFVLEAKKLSPIIKNNAKKLGSVAALTWTTLQYQSSRFLVLESVKNIGSSAIKGVGNVGAVFILAPTIITSTHWLSYKARYPNEKILSPVFWEKIGDTWVLSPRKGDLRASKQVKIQKIQDHKVFMGIDRCLSTSCVTGQKSVKILPIWKKKTNENIKVNIAKMFPYNENFNNSKSLVGSVNP